MGLLAERAQPAATEAVGEILAGEASAAIRRQAIQGLGRRPSLDDATRGLLERVLRDDADEELRELARSILER